MTDGPTTIFTVQTSSGTFSYQEQEITKDKYLIEGEVRFNNQTYSIKGAKVGKGNFLTYVERAAEVFGEDEAIRRDTARHMQKIRKALRKK